MIVVNEISVLQSRDGRINALKEFQGLASEHEIEELMIASDPNSFLQALQSPILVARAESTQRRECKCRGQFLSCFKKTYI